jgi:hypothetical protein
MALPIKMASGLGVMEWWSIAKYQIPISNDQNKKQVWNF